jgi:uncharacterized protein (UPF0335 family)
MPKPATKEDLFENGTNPLGNKETGQLRSFIERVEKLAEERQAVSDDIKEVYAEAKGAGLDPKAMKKIVAIRKMDREKWQAQQDIVDKYLISLGLL